MVNRALVLGLLAAVVIGCGKGDGLQRVVLSGDVTYLGRPVTEGSIVFVPSDGTSGPSLAVNVVDGRYRADSLGGVPVGNYRVEILAYRKNADGRQHVGPAPQLGSRDHADAPQQYLPVKYNVKSQLKTTVESGSGSLSKDFALEE